MIINYEDWKVEIKSSLIIFEKNAKLREYDLPKWKNVEHKDEYIFITLKDDSLIQFKMEFEDFLIGDLFDEEGEHLDSIACYQF